MVVYLVRFGVYVTPNMRTILLCKRRSPYANILAIPTRMHTGIHICIILHIGIQDLISRMETISLCIRLVTEISPYAYRHLTNPCMQTGISVMRSLYAYGDHQDPRMHTEIQLNCCMHTGIRVTQSLYAYRDLQDPRMHMGV
jgi:hypothetical protein